MSCCYTKKNMADFNMPKNSIYKRNNSNLPTPYVNRKKSHLCNVTIWNIKCSINTNMICMNLVHNLLCEKKNLSLKFSLFYVVEKLSGSLFCFFLNGCMIIWEKIMYTCMCNWVTMLYSSKLTEHCKSAMMEKNNNHYIKKIKIIIKLSFNSLDWNLSFHGNSMSGGSIAPSSNLSPGYSGEFRSLEILSNPIHNSFYFWGLP